MTGYFSPGASRISGQRRRWARILRFGPPLVSVTALVWAGQAFAQTTISTDTTAPLATSKTGDLTIAAGGTVKPASGVAVTIDSNNAVTNSGVIQFQNKDNVTGVLIQGGNTGSLTNNNTIQVDDTSTTTTDSNGVVHGPFASGTGRYGVRVVGPGAFTGSLTNSVGASITMKGDNSFGVSVETDLIGSINQLGTLTIQGTNSVGLRTTGAVIGDVNLTGVTSAAGQGTQAASLGGDISGALLINGTVSSSGYRYQTRSTDPTFLSHLTADDLLQGGPTVTVAGSVGKGILVDATSTTDTSGVVTSVAGSISSAAAAPALVVGAVGRDVHIGDVGTGVDAFGIEIKGSVLGSGIYDGVSASAIQLGVAGGGAVTTGDGIRISGTVGATAYAASATALQLNSGVAAPVIRNEGSLAAIMNSDAAGAAARALVIGAGANVAVLQNAATLSATVAGQKADAIAITDKSGTLSEIENIGLITTSRTITDITQAVTGKSIAMDLSANTGGVHIVQTDVAGDTLVPAIQGSVLLGSGADRVEILGGLLIGDLDLGAGANTLTIDGGAIVNGALNAQGGTVALSVGTGSLTIKSPSQLSLTSLTLGSASSVIFTADPATNTATKLDVAGTATIASGAKIGVRLDSILQNSATYTLIHANQLNAGAIDSSLLGSVPFLYDSSLKTDTAAGTVTATLSRKSAAELGLPTTTAGAYEPLVQNISKDTGLEGALLAQTTRAGLINLYNQLLPNHSGSIFNIAAASVSAFSRPLDDRQDPVGGGFWLQETNLGIFSDGKNDDPGYKGWSVGAVGGYEIPRTAFGILGATFGISANQIYPDNVDSAEDLHTTLMDAGIYWRTTHGGFSANARLGGDYMKVSSKRVVEVLGGDGLAVSRTANGEWSAYGFNARGMVAYEKRFGRYYLRPQLSLDYMQLMEGAYTETGGGDGMDLSVKSRTSSRLAAFAGVALGATYGPTNSWGPEVLVGYKGVASQSLGDTTARFVGGGDAFTLRSDDIGGQGVAAHISLKGENGSGGFAVETGAETRDGLAIYDLKLAGHVQF
ncbi:MAG: autotransporter [Phenylobacterium sp.]|uniref:autotransporter outer membrane beta-barrel domain-containing protein n=1 Tax=Phenylobacterium sp. TaxID=1871053 RepID=UPI002625AF4F|nr:autotransporter outer membrane beta-barrel domain-containing protein [Phenylobacterium sp.]MDB5496814.1 autotransporter [Phenylobacterium sp.]